MPTRHPPRKPNLNTETPSGQPTNTFIIRQIEAGSDAYSAAGAAGIPPPLLTTWLNEGRVQWTRATASTADWARDFTPEQQDLALFYAAVNIAEATNQSRGSIMLEQHVRGGLEKRSRRRKSVNGVVVEEHESVETTLPNFDALKFKLERRHADVYGLSATLHLSTVDLSDTPDVGRALTEAMQAVARRMEAIEVTATDADDEDGDGDE